MKTLLTLSLSSILLVACSSLEKHDASMSSGHVTGYRYNELLTKDYDEMLAMVQNLVRKAKAAAGEDGTANEEEVVGLLREALKLIFSRPDSDNMVAKLVPEARRMMLGFNAYEPSVASIAKDAIRAVKSDDASAITQSTSLFILDNLLGEVTPEVKSNPRLRAVVETIRDAKLTVSEKVIKERKIRGMFQTKSPSDIARGILQPLEGKKNK